MADTFNYRATLRDLHTSIVNGSDSEEVALINSLESFLRSNQVDHFIGGLQSHDNTVATKSVYRNALFIDTFASAASYLSHSGFSQAAIMAGQFLQSYALTAEGLYCNTALDQTIQHNISDLHSTLTDDQWLAIKHYFELPESGTYRPHNLSIATPRTHLPSATGLHPKQVPLALDAALSMGAMLCSKNLPIKQVDGLDYAANALLVRAFFSLSHWLHQQQFAELGQELLTRLSDIPHVPALQMLDATLASLRYQWRDKDFQKLSELVNEVIGCQLDAENQSGFTHGVSIQDLSALLSIDSPDSATDFKAWPSYQSCLDDTLSHDITTQYKSCIIIKGPEFKARQWLQSAGNQFQFNHRFYAIPSDETIYATSISADGERRCFMDLNALLDYSQPSNASLHRLL